MNSLRKLQKFLPIGALGISLILHLAIFLGISGIILIQAVTPKIVPSGDALPAAATDIPSPPDLPEDIQENPTPQTDDAALEAPQMPSFSIDQISSANTSSAPAYSIAPPSSLPMGALTEAQEQSTPQKSSNAERKTSAVFRTMSNPFGQVASADDGGLIGYMFDFKQTSSRNPSSMAGDPEAGVKADPFTRELIPLLAKQKDGTAKPKDLDQIKELQAKIAKVMEKENTATRDYHEAVVKYVTSGWPDKPAGDFYRTEKPLALYQLFIPVVRADFAPEAFGAQAYVKPRRWIIVYKGSFTSPVTGQYRFVGHCDDLLVVNFKGKNVLDGSLLTVINNDPELRQKVQTGTGSAQNLWAGKWMTLEEGATYPLKVLIGEQPGGVFYAFLLIQKKGDDNEPLPVVQFNPTNWPPKFPAKWNIEYKPGVNAPAVAKKPFVCQ
ncbi:MAG: hypothetical protein LBK76_09755 [Verrucomicrobiales bacterium]|jgi:hypothetical protein|nr:hypothetical protein [Verrucomicrobiales bacterium]